MKVFERKNTNKFRCPDEMEVILKYLKEKGTINVSEEDIESLYEDFSEEFYCAGWMSVLNATIFGSTPNIPLLEQFADYLEQQDI